MEDTGIHYAVESFEPIYGSDADQTHEVTRTNYYTDETHDKASFGTFDDPDAAYEVAYALCHAEHKRDT